MEDHERDRNKARNRLSRFLTAIQEATSPKNEQQIEKPVTTEVTQTSSTSDIALPTIPAAAIFTSSRPETSVTTTLLNTPISSVLTTSRESSPQTQVVNADQTAVDNSGNCSMTSAPNSPQVSTNTTQFNSSIPPLSTSIGVTKPLAQENTLKFDAKADDNNPKPIISTKPSTQLVSPTVMFSSPITTSSQLTIPSFSSSTPQIPQFSSPISSSAPLPIPNFSQQTIAFNSQSQPTFPTIQQNNSFPSEAQSASFFSVGFATSGKKSTQSQRTRRQRR
jgi:hypothetical protein